MKGSFTLKINPRRTVERIKAKDKLLGDKNEINLDLFLNIRLLGTILVIILFLTCSRYGFILGPIMGIVFYKGLEIICFDIKINKRKEKLESEAIFFFQVLSLTIEGGRNLKQAISITSKNVQSELSLEFREMLEEVTLGKSFHEALRNMKYKIPSESINNTILSMIESEVYGSSLKDSIDNQIDYLNKKQILNVKAKINKLPTKISVISVIFFIPIMMLIILAPVLIEFLYK